MTGAMSSDMSASRARQTRLIILGGLPGTGKTSLARAIAKQRPAMHVRIDSIEQALREASAGIGELADAGYRVAYAVALDNLRCGLSVVADCVNPVHATRSAWRAVARSAGVPASEVQVLCSDASVHEQRATTRVSEIQGLALPTWAQVRAREYEPWTADVTIDTAHRTPAECVAELLAALG